MDSIFDFMCKILSLRVEFPFSVTSWIRTEKRNNVVGGKGDSFHLAGLGIDIVLDNPGDNRRLIARAKRYNLDAVDEGDHVHLEPRG